MVMDILCNSLLQPATVSCSRRLEPLSEKHKCFTAASTGPAFTVLPGRHRDLEDAQPQAAACRSHLPGSGGVI